MVAERERLGSELRATASQRFVAIGMLAHHDAERLPADSPWAVRSRRLGELADQGKWELDQSLRALAHLPGRRRSLTVALRALAASMSADSGMEILVDVDGRTRRLAPRVERAVYRVTNEALLNAWRHARCAAARAEIRFAPNQLRLRVVDEGIGLALRYDQRAHLGIDGMRRTVLDVGGSLRVRTASPRGVAVEVAIPVTRP